MSDKDLNTKAEEPTYDEKVRKARELFDTLDDLDGCGLVTVDNDLLARSVAERYGVKPEEVYDEYDPDTEDDEDAYENHYRCDDCSETWTCTGDSAHDDECPKCGKAYTPYKSVTGGDS